MENQSNNLNHYEEELEINLNDFIRVLWRRKKVILTIFIATVLLVSVVTFILSKTYQASLMIKPGQVNGKPLESPQTTVKIFNQQVMLEKIADRFNWSIKKSLKIRSLFKLSEARELIQVDGLGQTPEQALKTVNTVTAVLLEHQTSLFAETKKNKEQEMKNLKDKIVFLEGEIAPLEAKIRTLIYNPSEAQARITAALIASLDNKRNQKNVYELELFKKQQELISQTFESKIEVPATLPLSSIKPNKTVNISLAAVLGLFIGVLCAFWLEYREKSKVNKNLNS